MGYLTSWLRIQFIRVHFYFWQKCRRARPGFEPGTSRTLSENHTPRPTSQHSLASIRTRTLFRVYKVISGAPHCTAQEVVDLVWVKYFEPSLALRDGVKKVDHNLFPPGLEPGPCACEAHVITTTLRKLCSGSPLRGTNRREELGLSCWSQRWSLMQVVQWRNG